jgi:hypothetical protein
LRIACTSVSRFCNHGIAVGRPYGKHWYCKSAMSLNTNGKWGAVMRFRTSNLKF